MSYIYWSVHWYLITLIFHHVVRRLMTTANLLWKSKVCCESWSGWFEGYVIYPLILRFRNFYFRYINDINLIWNKKKKEEFQVFLQKINNCHSTIKFECQTSHTEINFLDTKFSKLVINSALNFIQNQLINEVIYIANQKTPVLWRIVLHIVKLCIWIKFAATMQI